MSFKNKIKKILASENSKKLCDSMALQKLVTLSNSYIPWTSSSIRPSAIVKILNDILINKRKYIIEFGSGISTLYIAKLLKNNGGYLYSVEHDKNWILVVKDILKKEGVEDVVVFAHAPMGKSTYSLNDLEWYDKKSLDVLSTSKKFDLILIDGPMAYTEKLMLSRYPAVPFLMEKDKISKNSTIILDDINRSGEEAIVKKWEQEYGFKFTRLYNDAGIAIAVNGNSYNI